MLILPSGRQLRKYKISQKSGIIPEALEWMNYAAVDDAKLPEHGWVGGIHQDERKDKKIFSSKYWMDNQHLLDGWTQGAMLTS